VDSQNRSVPSRQLKMEENDEDDEDQSEYDSEDDSEQEEEDEQEDEEDEDDDEQEEGKDAWEDTDLDPEKLRAYEVSKLKYYFAVAEFSTSEAADAAYKELDGVEVGHSSATIDLRSIPERDVEAVIQGRKLRDEATNIPSKYVLPDFVVAALQQSSVRCTWDEGDKERERLLTAYGAKKGDWLEMEDDDLRAYLASGMACLALYGGVILTFVLPETLTHYYDHTLVHDRCVHH